MKTININTSSKNYNIYIGEDILKNSGKIIKSLDFNGGIMLVTDDNVAPLYLDTVKKSLENIGFTVNSFIIRHGEENKNINTIMQIYEALQKAGINRKDMIIALGGGVVGDMAGFSAATYLRGIKYVQMPTSLLAQVDSSIGGKTGIDLPFGKNLVGAFCQPEAVIADINTIKTLPKEQISSGMAEVIKSALIADEDFVNLLENSTSFDVDLSEFITRSIIVKKYIVEIDEFEKYERMQLNFGHTLGHSIEKVMNFTGITHGQAVAIGMCLVTKNIDIKGRIINILKKYNLDTEINIPVSQLIESAKNDKKASSGGINIVTLEKVGKAVINKLSFEEISEIYG